MTREEGTIEERTVSTTSHKCLSTFAAFTRLLPRQVLTLCNGLSSERAPKIGISGVCGRIAQH